MHAGGVSFRINLLEFLSLLINLTFKSLICFAYLEMG